VALAGRLDAESDSVSVWSGLLAETLKLRCPLDCTDCAPGIFRVGHTFCPTVMVTLPVVPAEQPCAPVALNDTVNVWPACASLGVKLNAPEAGLPVAGLGVNEAPDGRFEAVRVIVSVVSVLEAPTLKFSAEPGLTVWAPGRFSVGQIGLL